MIVLVEADNLYEGASCQCGCYDHCSCDTESCMCDGQCHEG